MKAYLTHRGVVVESNGEACLTDLEWDDLFATDAPGALLEAAAGESVVIEELDVSAPIASQEVWAAGVTYIRSRTARMSESEKSGGGSFYDRVYAAERPELFFKATKSRVVGPEGAVRIRADSTWSVPEPELALAISVDGHVIGYTIGDDVSARDIEGENPLYLPQAKVYRDACALGPSLYLSSDPLPSETEIRLAISRGGSVVFEDRVHLSRMKRKADELVGFLFRDNVFPHGCYLLTGTGIVPPDEFALRSGDKISITIEPIGTLVNSVA